MSHRVTTQTEIKDKTLAIQALKHAKLAFQEVGGDKLRVTTPGPLNGATINLKTGAVEGDTDYGHTTDGLGMLRQHYGLMKYKAECSKQGITIQSETTEKNGNIRLHCVMN